MLAFILSPIRRRPQHLLINPNPNPHLIRLHFYGTKPTASDVDETTVLDAISSYENDWERALEFFRWAPRGYPGFTHTLHTFNKMIDILGKFFEYDQAWNLIDQMSANPLTRPDHVTFRILFKRYAAAHLVAEAVDAYHRSQHYGLKDKETFFNLVDALCEYRHVVEMCDFLNCHIDLDAQETTKFHNLKLRGWFKMGWWSKCRECWAEMDELGVSKDLHSYSIYMNIFCKSGKPWKAVKLYKEMKLKKIGLDTVAYNTVIQAVGICDGVDQSISVLREMCDVGCKPNVVTYNIVVGLLCEAGRLKEAWELVKKMGNDDCAPNAITFHCFFKHLSKPKSIMRLFDRMLVEGPPPTMETYVMLLKKFGRWGFLRPVFEVWKKMKKQGLSPDAFAYNAFIDALMDKGMFDMARSYETEMLKKGLAAKPRKELGTKILTEFSDEDPKEEIGSG